MARSMEARAGGRIASTVGVRHLAWFVSLVTACHLGPDPGDGVDASPAGDLVCESGGVTFPPLDKRCARATDCFIAVHQVNCCGTQAAVGFNRSAQVAFEQAEPGCAAAYPGCGCAQFPTMAEDGRTETDGPIEVRCDADQLCRTFVP